MCGIVAIFSYREGSSPVSQDELIKIRDAMISRGPDGHGLWIDKSCEIGLAHRRLSIIDLSDAASQPMMSEDGKIGIVFNGEIYNYQAIRDMLKQEGFHFRTSGDTEVLLHLYAHKGQDMVHELRGMYAFAIWDQDKQGLFIARDPFGIKPLYYADDGYTLRIASQIKALLKGGYIDTSPEPAGHVGFFLWGHVPEPYTLYKGIRSLPAGTSLWIDKAGRKEFRTFYNIQDVLSDSIFDKKKIKDEDRKEYLRDALMDSVRHHMIADVPVGVFLSSGLDSGTLTALASETEGSELQTISLGFHEYKGSERDETILAEQVAKHYRTSHNTRWISKSDFESDFHHLLNVMDQPTIDGVNTYFVSKVASESGLKAALSGVGGDELFGGYSSFRQIPQLLRFVQNIPYARQLERPFHWISTSLLKRFTSPKYAGLLEYGKSCEGAYLLRRSLFMPWELPTFLEGDLVREGWKELQPLIRLEETIRGIKSDHLKISALEMSWYMRNQLLRDSDWAGMAHSLEIRVPFVDIELLKKIVSLSLSNLSPRKADMANTPIKSLPDKILYRDKTGFSIPVQEWLAQKTKNTDAGLKGWAKTVYTANRSNK